jgi:DNA-binding NarL/FixJ family response regulator
MVSHGMANKEIARQLDISERTVKFHLSLIFRRLQVRNRLQAVNAATRSHGLRDPQLKLN